jgi:hypothetical protein
MACPQSNWLGGNGLEWFPGWTPVCPLLRCKHLCTLLYKQKEPSGRERSHGHGAD